MTASLIGIAIIFPFAAGFICLTLKNHKARAGVVFLSAIVLIATSILFFSQGTFPLGYTPSHEWDMAIFVLDYLLMAYFLYLGLNDFFRNGIKIRNVSTIGLVLVQAISLALFEFSWAPELPITVEPALFIDHLSLIMCLIICIIGSLICIYGIKYMQDHEKHLGLEKTKQNWFFFYMVMFLGAMNGIVFANNILWLYFFWEVTTLCCYALIRHDETPEAIESGFRALWMNLIGGVGFVAAIILAFNSYGTLSLITLISNPTPFLLLPLAFLFLAALTKSAQVPFQGWLLGAMVAPVPVSALLHSSTMVKAGVYLAVRIAPAFWGTSLSAMIAVFGGFTFMATAILAISQSEAKRVLAYSTISNLGLIILCAGINTPLAITAAIMLIIFHAISKGLLFLCVGNIEHNIWSKNIEDMQGLVRRLPLITGITIAGMISMLLAPFGVLISKWAAIEAAGASASLLSPLILLFLVIGSAATTVFWVKWIGRFLSEVPSTEGLKMEPFSPLYHTPVMLLIGGAVVLSILIAPVYNWLVSPAVGTFYLTTVSTQSWFFRSAIGCFVAWPLFIVLAAALVVPSLFVKTKPERIRAAYMCGENVEYDTPQFRSVADDKFELQLGGVYLQEDLGEKKLDKWFKVIALIILLVLFAVVLV